MAVKDAGGGASGQELIRNFCIIAHIDHGKSTLADRLLEATGAWTGRNRPEQALDQMDLERERGITIKLQAVRLSYRNRDGRTYTLNLIDTPGHVDFSYEVSRSLAACEGALLLVDASQGVEAQTLANYRLALDSGLEVIPVINKIDLPGADPESTRRQIEETLVLDAGEAIPVSAKEGIGVDAVLQAVVDRIPPPKGSPDAPLQALIFDSHYDSYRGVIAYLRVFQGTITKGVTIRMMASGKTFEADQIGIFRPALTPTGRLSAGEVGFLTAAIKNVGDCRVGDTVTEAARSAAQPLPGYRRATPMVFCGLYPAEGTEFEALREALEKLQLNDASLHYEPETSAALGFGYRCGFLGLLHKDIVQERLEREYGLDLITTAPNVAYQYLEPGGELRVIDNPAAFPEHKGTGTLEEPYVRATMFCPQSYVGPVMELAQGRRGEFKSMDYLDGIRVVLQYEIPLGEILYDFFDQLKSKTRGYASLDYEFSGYRESDLVKLNIMVHGEVVDALSAVVHRSRASYRARQLVEKLRELIPRQLFDIPVQAAIGGRIIARETIKALRKNVLAKCYGGDVTRKRKLLEKQREGKRRMKQVGRVEIPQEAFMAVLKTE